MMRAANLRPSPAGRLACRRPQKRARGGLFCTKRGEGARGTRLTGSRNKSGRCRLQSRERNGPEVPVGVGPPQQTMIGPDLARYRPSSIATDLPRYAFTSGLVADSSTSDAWFMNIELTEGRFQQCVLSNSHLSWT